MLSTESIRTEKEKFALSECIRNTRVVKINAPEQTSVGNKRIKARFLLEKNFSDEK
jgi:hypothetical protein